jgi:D-arabinono-1,4-lactone oxidase
MTGGITHQNLGGFFLVGSAGGSLHHTFHDGIIRIRLIDGTGTIREFEKDDDENNLFYAVGVSMGLMGIVSTVTIEFVPRYDLVGKEVCESYQECSIDLFGDGDKNKPSLEKHFWDNEFSRIMFYPQPGVEKVVIWQARKMKPEEYNELVPSTSMKDFMTPQGLSLRGAKRRPYEELPNIVQTLGAVPRVIVKMLCSLFKIKVEDLPQHALGALWYIFGHIPYSDIPPKLFAWVFTIFMPLDKDNKDQNFGPKYFQDSWLNTLPMDNGISDEILPVQFSEIWIPVEKTKDMINLYRDHCNRHGFVASGFTFSEVYPAKRTKFWMSPCYNKDVMRIDFSWFEGSLGEPDEFFRQFYDLFIPLGYSHHWGKLTCGWPEYLKNQYPRWDDWMKVREEYDPRGVFLTKYWCDTLGIREPDRVEE